jgi:hypothetical protein
MKHSIEASGYSTKLHIIYYFEMKNNVKMGAISLIE